MTDPTVIDPTVDTAEVAGRTGLSRGRFCARSLVGAHEVLVALKGALDPAGILNPGRLGIPSSFGEVPWP